MSGNPIRTAIVAVLLKIETTEGVDAGPSASADAIPVEIPSIKVNSPYKTDTSNEATGVSVASAPLIIGQPATISFQSKIRGAGQVYTATVKPPLHQALQACGKRGLFTAAIATALATAGGATSATLASTFPTTPDALIGMPLSVTAGAGAGATPLISDYSAGRVATLVDSFSPVLDTTSSIALPANWTYCGTTPANAAARATDQPSATIYLYRDGRLKKFVGCRGKMGGTGQNARPGFAQFDFTGIYAGDTDAAMPTGLVIPGATISPTLVQGTNVSSAALLNRKALPISSWTWDNGADISSPDDPNTLQGFGAGLVGGRAPTLKLDPLADLIATRNVIADIAAGNQYTGALRYGSVAGNRWSLTFPQLQPITSDDGERDDLLTEEITLQVLAPATDVTYTRDAEGIICFS